MITNRMFSTNDQVFKLACELANIKPTKRQASKFRMGKGLAINFKPKAIHDITILKNEEVKNETN